MTASAMKSIGFIQSPRQRGEHRWWHGETAPSGHTATTPPYSVMKSRRLINFSEAQRKPSYRLKLALGKVPIGVKKLAVERPFDVRFGSIADSCRINCRSTGRRVRALSAG